MRICASNGRQKTGWCCSRPAAAVCLIIVATAGALALRGMKSAPPAPVPEFRAYGPADAPLVIDEFSDFACPACRSAAVTLEQLLETYRDKVRVHFKHYPLSMIHPWSLQAAAYADCAGAQGKFWEYGNLLFKDQELWARSPGKPAQFEAYGRQLGLDYTRLEACADSAETRSKVQLDMAEGDARDVNSTPTFFVNGKRAVGGRQLAEAVHDFFLSTGAARKNDNNPGGK